MRHQNDAGPVVPQILDGGQTLADAGVVSDDGGARLMVQRHVKVYAHEDALAGEIKITNRFLRHIKMRSKVKAGRKNDRSGRRLTPKPSMLKPCGKSAAGQVANHGRCAGRGVAGRCHCVSAAGDLPV